MLSEILPKLKLLPWIYGQRPVKLITRVSYSLGSWDPSSYLHEETWHVGAKAKHESTLDTFPFLCQPYPWDVWIWLCLTAACSGSPAAIWGESHELTTLIFPCLTITNQVELTHYSLYVSYTVHSTYSQMCHVCNMHVSEIWRWQRRSIRILGDM
jgi:hypothetical protein